MVKTSLCTRKKRTRLRKVKTIIGDFWIGEIMLMIVGFYFGGGLAESVRKK